MALTNAFLVRSNDPLAIRYNDKYVAGALAHMRLHHMPRRGVAHPRVATWWTFVLSGVSSRTCTRPLRSKRCVCLA